MYVLDIEASGLADESYPIEIAWCTLDGTDSYSTLINPESAGGWDYWDEFAETAFHGISRDRCCRDGQNVLIVAQQVERVLSEYPVFSDAPYQDQRWLKRLFEAVDRQCPAILMPLDHLVRSSKQSELNQRLSLLSRPHRALDDCLQLAQVVQQVRQEK